MASGSTRNLRDAKTKRLARVRIDIELPPSFLSGHRDAVVRAAGACKVKKTLAAPPDIVVHASASGTANAA